MKGLASPHSGQPKPVWLFSATTISSEPVPGAPGLCQNHNMPDTLTRRSLLAAAAVPVLRLPKKIRIGIAEMEGHVGEILKPIDGLADVELVSVSDPEPAKMAKL